METPNIDTNLEFIKKLIRLKTTPEYPDQLHEALSLIKEECKDFTIEEFKKGEVESILIYPGEVRPKRFGLILNTHLDVIPGHEEQYEPRIEGDKLYGVGAMDMKGNMVAAMEAFKEVASSLPYPVGLQVVTDEEIGGFDGTKYQIEQGVEADFVLSTEPTNFDIVHEAKGVLWAKITARGITAHGAYPWRGQNAVELITSYLDRVKEVIHNPTEETWQTTVNVAGIDTPNSAYNKIPDECRLRLDIRFIPSEKKQIIMQLESLLLEGCEIEILAHEPALETSKDDPHVTILRDVTEKIINKPVVLRAAQGSSDARHYRHINVPGIEFGPIGAGIGGDEEWVSISGLVQYQELLKEYMQALSDLK